MKTYRMKVIFMAVALLWLFTVPAIGAEMEQGKMKGGMMQEGMMPMMGMMTCMPMGMTGGMMSMMCMPMMGMDGMMMSDEMKEEMMMKHGEMMMKQGEMMMKQGQMMMDKGKKGMMKK